MAKAVSFGAIEDDKLVLSRENMDRIMKIDKGVGAIEKGQVLAFNPTSGKLVKYDEASADAKDIFTVYTGDSLTEASAEDFDGTVLCFGSKVNRDLVKGLSYATQPVGVYKLYRAGIILEEVKG